MALTVITPSSIQAASVKAMGLDPDSLDLTATESLACSLRRAAGFFCPCSGRSLLCSILNPLKGLVIEDDELREKAEETLEALITYGDLLELNSSDQDDSRQLLYLAPPAYVRRNSGTVFLLGILPDNVSLLPDEIERQVECTNHVRRLQSITGEDFVTQLKDLGFMELSSNNWLKSPNNETANGHLERLNDALDVSTSGGDVPGLVLLDPRKPVQYYRGRWTEPTNQTGRFIARRAQAYGSDVWCYAEIDRGRPVRFIDLPLKHSIWRGCDEAWRLQTAIDHIRGNPQEYRIRQGPSGSRILDSFSPVPMWVKRRWDALGESVAPSRCLFSYRFLSKEIEEEIRYLRTELWLTEMITS